MGDAKSVMEEAVNMKKDLKKKEREIESADKGAAKEAAKEERQWSASLKAKGKHFL